MDFISLGSSPIEEDCVQVGSEDYYERAKEELKRFKELVLAKMGHGPEGAYLKIKAFPHDFGTYHELVVVYNEDSDRATAYAYACEENIPLTWNDVEAVDWEDTSDEDCNDLD